MLKIIVNFFKSLLSVLAAFFYGQARMENKNLKKKVKIKTVEKRNLKKEGTKF